VGIGRALARYARSALTNEDTMPQSLARINGRRASQRFARQFRQILQYDRTRKRAIVLAVDVVLCWVSAFLAFSLRVGALAFPAEPFILFAASASLLFVPIFFKAGVYAAIFRFAGIGTIRDVVRASVIYAIPLVVIFMIIGVPGIPRTIALIHPIIFLGLISFSRSAMRQVLTEMRIDPETGALARRAIIYGAGSAGVQLSLSIRHAEKIVQVAFVDDDRRLDGQRLEGAPVYSSDKLETLIEDEQVDTVLLALPNAGRKRRREIIERLRPLPVEVQTLPQVEEVVDGHVSYSDLREVQIDDLLGRESVSPNEILLSRTISGKAVMVTGAGGSIGSELCRQIVSLRPRRLVLLEMTEHSLYEIENELLSLCESTGVRLELHAELLTLVDAEATRRAFNKWRPDTVFHAAAYKHVPLVEKNVISGLRNNILGTRNAARAAKEAGVNRFILVSTDKAVRPTNVMGASKRACELILQNMAQSGGTRFAMVRFGNVLGSSGSVVPRFKQQIRDGGPVTLTDRRVTRYFMTIPEAAQLVIQAGAMAEGGEVYLLEMGASIRIYDLARTMIELSGLTVRDEDNPKGDIEIREIGLREGEKLYEELLIDADAEPTGHPQILRAREKSLDEASLEALVVELTDALDRGDRPAALDILRLIVPEYAPREERMKIAANDAPIGRA
jgi:FlaA1/EpsC-like NDP-sugar epimerase